MKTEVQTNDQVPCDVTQGSKRRIRTFVRNRGKRLRQSQKKNLEALLASRSFGNHSKVLTRAELGEIWSGRPSIWMEIGFGNGDHLLHLCEQNPELGLIGCEPYANGVAAMAAKAGSIPEDQLKIHQGDALDVLAVLPDGCLGRVYLLFPDPWPKRAHHKRRFINERNLDLLGRAMQPGAELRIASDWPDYVNWCLNKLTSHPLFVPVNGVKVTDQPWPDWLPTHYEKKAVQENRTPQYLIWNRI